ncbi:MAG: hypothetical protein IKS48_00475 [Eubacterium sp.]|nr:hypothetical protein [Eubacterium sp.]
MKAYIITRENLTDFTSEIISVYSKKDVAKKCVDRLNEMENDDSIDYRIQSFTMDAEESYE